MHEMIDVHGARRRDGWVTPAASMVTELTHREAQRDLATVLHDIWLLKAMLLGLVRHPGSLSGTPPRPNVYRKDYRNGHRLPPGWRPIR